MISSSCITGCTGCRSEDLRRLVLTDFPLGLIPLSLSYTFNCDTCKKSSGNFVHISSQGAKLDPRGGYDLLENMSQDAHDAPEVVEGSGADGLIPTYDVTAKMPQRMHQYPAYGQQGPPSFQEDRQYTSAYGKHDEKLVGVGLTESSAHSQSSNSKRKRVIWIIIAAILLALAIGLGVGLGVGLSQKSSTTTSNASNNSEEATSDTNNNTSTSPTTTSTTTTTTTPTSSAVTSGSTGLAQFSCNSTETTLSPGHGVPYTQECYTQYQTNHPSYYSTPSHNITMTNLGGKITVYTFQDCLDKCDEWNLSAGGGDGGGGGQPACRAVTYYANLTVPIQRYGGNCFLKNDRGFGYQNDVVDYAHMASAYQGCLNRTCFAGVDE